MGDMANYFLASVIDEECSRDDYASGHMDMHEAFDRGYIDSLGREQEGIQAAYDRQDIGTREQLDNSLLHASKDLKLGAYVQATTQRGNVALNAAAIANLSKPNPTCNFCGEQMLARDGRYGKFYFCAKRCEGQPTVSDTYWKSLKNEAAINRTAWYSNGKAVTL